MKKVGILGGTFDPPHFGHLIIAQEVQASLKLDKVWFIPTNIPPHKDQASTSAQHRFEMVKRAIRDNDAFDVQPLELERNGPSYSIDTINILKERYPSIEFYFIIGGDMVEYLPRWYQIDELVQKVRFVGVKRPGFKLKSRYPIEEVEVPEFDVSSSMLRERFYHQGKTRYFLPENVRSYIEENKLYENK